MHEKIKKLKPAAKAKGQSEEGYYLLKQLYAEVANLRRGIISRMQTKTTNYIVTCGKHTTTGGSTSEVISDAKIKSNMVCSVILTDEGATPVEIVSAKCSDGQLTVEFSADPATDHQLDYVIVKNSKI